MASSKSKTEAPLLTMRYASLLRLLLPLILAGVARGFTAATNPVHPRRASSSWQASSPVAVGLFPNANCPPRKSLRRTGSLLAAESSSSTGGTATDTAAASEGGVGSGFDFDAVFKYAAAVATQLALLYAFFSGLDRLVALSNLEPSQIPFAANFALFYLLALKSRVFNPLANNRPKVETMEVEGEVEQKRKMPSWTPPGPVFPIVWLLVIGPIRAATSAMVYSTAASYANPAIMALMLHLSIGDVWNTINNVEKRYGASVVGVLCVWLSKAFAAYQYYQVNPLAGKILALPLVWLTVASALITRTWQLNPDPATGEPEPLYPVAGRKKTKFAWFSFSSG